jgi:hypothetical protein
MEVGMNGFALVMLVFFGIAATMHFLSGGSLDGLFYETGRLVILAPLVIGAVLGGSFLYARWMPRARHGLRQVRDAPPPPPSQPRNERSRF